MNTVQSYSIESKPSSSNLIDLDAPLPKRPEGAKAKNSGELEANQFLDSYSLESLIELKISRFLEQIGDYYPQDLHDMFLQKIERPLIKQIMHRTGGNQVQAARILGINRNTLRKKIKVYGIV